MAIVRMQRGAALVIGGIFAFSLALAVVLDPDTGFYLLPTRLYEFSIGGAIALAPVPNPTWQHFLGWAGIGGSLIAGAIFHPSTPWPTGLALLPCLSAGAVILGGGSLQNPLLRNHVAGQIGRASYSIYLAHWPVITFGRDLIG